MDYLHTIILGFMQGLTEFLPVSSSGHIVITSAIYKLLTGMEFVAENDEEIFFDIMLHFGTLVALLIYFKKEIISIIKAFFVSLKNRKFDTYESKLMLYIFVGTFFTCLVVYPIKDICIKLVNMPSVIGITLMITGGILLLSEFLSNKINKQMVKVDMKKSILIGIAQGIAAVPGISRSGSTIAMAIALGIKRQDAARYSFLLSIPVILLAVLYEIPDIAKPEVFQSMSWMPILAGTLVSTIVGYLCVKYFIIYLKRFSLNIFAYYCIIVGFISFLYF